MVNPLSNQSAMMREAIAAAQARIAAKASNPSATGQVGASGEGASNGFDQLLAAAGPEPTSAISKSFETGTPPTHGRVGVLDAIGSLDSEVKRAESLGADVITGKVQDLHEVAAQMKRTDLTFKFSLQVRDRLIEAYREVMRMGV